MINEIINLLPSPRLKDKIREIGHIFTESELLYIISLHAPTYEKKLDMLSRFADIASNEIAEITRKFISFYQSHHDAFFAKTENSVFKVKIWDDNIPGKREHDFDFIAASFDAALAGIDRYYREYEEVATAGARYKIIKTHLFTGNESEDEDFRDYLGECLLGADKVLIEVDDESVPYDFSDADDSIDPYNAYTLAVPDFLENRDIILYEGASKALNYGVILEHKADTLCNYLYAIPLNSKYLTANKFADAYRDHEHPYVHSVIKTATTDELPEEMRQNYFAYMKYLDENPEA